MGKNYRGCPPGFVRLENDGASRVAVLTAPEYSGNRLYQTLGNLYTTPKAGLVFPDFGTGDVLYVTGTTKILIDEEATQVLTRSKLAVQVNVTAARSVQQGLPFRGLPGERSPYNPPVRYLSHERLAAESQRRARKQSLPS